MTFSQWLSYCLPRKLVYWAMIRAGAEATTELYEDTIVSELAFMEALKRFKDGGNDLSLPWPIRLRKLLLIPGSWAWNAWVRDITAKLELRFT